MTTIPPLLTSLIDNAAIFPPAQTPLADAVSAHRRHRSAWYGDLVGPFLCRASAIDDLDTLTRDNAPFGVAIVVDTGVQGLLTAVDLVAGCEHLALRGVEIPLRGEFIGDSARRVVAGLDAALGGPDDEEPAYVEIPRAPGWEAALDVIAESGYSAKLRTGGDDPAAYPSSAEVSSFIRACLDRGVAFKFTAGLHRAVRHTTDTGRENGFEHGFLNVLLAVDAALDPGTDDAIQSVLSSTDAHDLAHRAQALTNAHAESIRRWFSSYGSCSIDEPLADLKDLGLVAPPGSPNDI